jgi:hypothetical protein
LKKTGRELYEVLDANEDSFYLKEEVEYDGDDGLSYLWGSVFRYPSLAFVSTYQKKLVTSNEGGHTKTLFQQDKNKFEVAETTASSNKDVNGLRFAPSCDTKCFIGEERCAHEDYFRVELNNVGDYVAFPAVWWHHGICDFYLPSKIFFTAQLFATPRSDIASNERSMRNSSKMKKHIQGKLNASFVNNLMTDLYLNWDEEYSATKFPTAKKFFGDIDQAKNRHILSHQIPYVPKIHCLVLKIEEEVGDITVDSVWLIKKTITDDGFQEWQQDFKHKITKTIVVNVGVVEDNARPYLVVNNDEEEYVELLPPPSENTDRWIPIAQGWQVSETKKKPHPYLQAYLDCRICSPNKSNQICALGAKYRHAYTYGQDWYMANFIGGFCVLVVHSVHDEVPSYKTRGVYVKNLVVPQVPKVPLTQADVVKFGDHVTHFVSTVYDRSHFAVLLFNLEARHVTVYDGLPCDLKKWENNVTYILRKYNMQDCNDMPSVTVTKGTDDQTILLLYFSDENEGPWLIGKDPKLKQYDGINCGPIAVSAVASGNALTSNKGCSDKLMSYTNDGEKGMSILLPKSASDLVTSLHVGIRGTCAE